MMLYIAGVCYSWFAHQPKRREARLEQRGAARSLAPDPPAGPPRCLCGQGVAASAAFPRKLPGWTRNEHMLTDHRALFGLVILWLA